MEIMIAMSRRRQNVRGKARSRSLLLLLLLLGKAGVKKTLKTKLT